MTELDRANRNRNMLSQVNGVVKTAVSQMFAELQSAGFRPRIQCAWRSPSDQLAAMTSGHSALDWGYHNCTTLAGAPDALAVDALDDDAPLAPRRSYLLALARAARRHGMTTGILWGLPPTIRAALDRVIDTTEDWEGQIGWDPTHVEPVGLTVQQARAGMRPKASGNEPVNA